MRRGKQLFFTWPARVSEQRLLVSTHTKSTRSSEDTSDAVFALYLAWKWMVPAKSLVSSKAKPRVLQLPSHPQHPKLGEHVGREVCTQWPGSRLLPLLQLVMVHAPCSHHTLPLNPSKAAQIREASTITP